MGLYLALAPRLVVLFFGAVTVGSNAAIEGHYTSQQAEAGRRLYGANCAQCHGASLNGKDAPGLKGVAFLSSWGNAATLLEIFSGSMPPQAPGQLGTGAYVDILAYILSANGVSAGSRALTVETAGTINLATVTKTVPAESIAATDIPPPQAYTWGRSLPTIEIERSAPQLIGVAPPPVPRPSARSYVPVTNAMILNPPDGDWLMSRRTIDNQAYSPLDKINTETVDDLELAWAWPTEGGQQEAAPLVHDGIMFIAQNNNVVQALDARTGELLWEYRHPLPALPDSWAYQNIQARRQRNSVALYDDKVILTTADAKIVALDATTGSASWQVQVHDYKRGYSYTSGPLVVNDKIISAVSGCSIAGTAGGCFITAHDARTGRELWRFNTLNDPDNPKQDASWNGVPLEARWGGASWMTGAYDPRTDTTFWGTGMPGPYSALIRGSGNGSVLYTNNTLALNATTGKRKWNYSHLPGDNWDLDSPFERVLVDHSVEGKTHHLLVSVPGKNGIAFGLERDTGRYLWSRDLIFQNVVKRIDPKTGNVELNPRTIFKKINQEIMVCPSLHGGKLWQAGAFSPLTNSFYVPVVQSCSMMAPTVGEFSHGNYVGSVKFGSRVLPPDVDKAGVLEAFNIIDGKRLWRNETRTTITSSLLATAGGLIFAGDAGRYFKAFDQKTGKVLWRSRLNAPIGGFPMTYEVDGEQYLAVPTGYSSQAATAAALFPEIPVPGGSGNSVLVFKLRR